MKQPETVELVHIGGERKHVPIELITDTYIAIRWGQSGIYDLNLKSNVLTARSQKAQRKGKPHWSAYDIDAVRQMVKDCRHPKTENVIEVMKRHQESMPRGESNG